MESVGTRDGAPAGDPEGQRRRPSPRFLEAIQDIAQRIGLDADRIADGAAIEFKGVTFCLGHHGDLDPDGLVIYIQMGSVAPQFEALVFRHMLERNAMVPAAAGGYYALLPQTSIAALCARLAMSRAESVADAVLGYVGLFAAQVQEFDKVLQEGLRMARDAMAGADESAADL